MSDLGHLVIGLVVGAWIAFMATHSFMSLEKRKCEANLPRNAECVWAPPIEAMGNDQ